MKLLCAPDTSTYPEDTQRPPQTPSSRPSVSVHALFHPIPCRNPVRALRIATFEHPQLFRPRPSSPVSSNQNMSAFYYAQQHHQPASHHAASSHNHHGGRSRRAPRLSASQNSHRQFRGVRSMKELTEAPIVSAFRARFEAGRSFDLDDDLEFCPGLLTEDDVSCQRMSTRSLRFRGCSRPYARMYG